MRDEIVNEGEAHYFSGKQYQNPYPINSDEFNRFERGWVQALKKTDAGLLSSPAKESTNEYPIRPFPAKPQNSALEKAAADYKARKG